MRKDQSSEGVVGLFLIALIIGLKLWCSNRYFIVE